MFENATYAIVDVETSGSSPTFDRIIEIGVIRVENGKVVSRFETLLDPQKNLPSSITGITGIESEDLRGKPLFEDIAHEVKGLLEGAVFVAHNARFDYSFIKNELKGAGITFNAKCLCTVRLSRKLYPEHKKHDLTSIIERFGFHCECRHRAQDDAQVLLDFMQILKKDCPEEFAKAAKLLLKENTLPQFLEDSSMQKLPEGPGVYVFYGPEDEVLYVGKSRNIRYRVLSHFSNDHSTSKELHLCQQTVRVEGISTAGELSALLLESQMIKDLSPMYNRMLRRRSELVVAKRCDASGYSTVKLERIRSISAEDYVHILGIFKNIRQAKEFLKASQLEHELCPKLLGLESSKGPCFYTQIGKCKGACSAKEEASVYNARLSAAFKQRQIKAWPFGGPILVEEKIDDVRKHSFVLDNWCLLKSIQTDEDGYSEVEVAPSFDYDAYKIFVRYLKDPLYNKNIKILGNDYLFETSPYMCEEPVIRIT